MHGMQERTADTPVLRKKTYQILDKFFELVPSVKCIAKSLV